jgi:ABC-type transporter Mla MlaB component
MKIHSHSEGPVTVLTAHGPLIAEELHDLLQAIEDLARPAATPGAATSAGASAPPPLGPRRVVVDVTDVPYLDSAGIELLLELFGSQVLPHRRPKLAALSETCREALELTEVLPRLDVFDTVENALRACQR